MARGALYRVELRVTMAVVWGEGLESLLLRCFSSERILLKTLVIYVAIVNKRPLRCAIVTVASKVKGAQA